MPADERRQYALPVIASLPMIGALAGGWVDERRSLGFTNWRSACRAGGLDVASLADFTWQLLPFALTGLLLGGCIVLALAIGARRRPDHASMCLAAHAGCVMTLPIAALLCASALPVPLMLLADLGITVMAALALAKLLRPASRRAAANP